MTERKPTFRASPRQLAVLRCINRGSQDGYPATMNTIAEEMGISYDDTKTLLRRLRMHELIERTGRFSPPWRKAGDPSYQGYRLTEKGLNAIRPKNLPGRVS